ncbi:MAG: bifunctional nuclease family protein [Actinobacteria bacterium]|jgi:bifunctional DNase/RNase|nr:bifunctional nuclease family protein [Actinomycetota bacterium]MDA2996632.1 bifunctional nuclease family protein [Actinomycetota bacterium]
MSELRLVEVIGVRVEMPSNQPIVLLKEVDGIRYLPIWVGAAEATAIAFAQQGLTPPRPLTHDLIKNIIDNLGTSVDSVQITHLADGVFYSKILMDKGIEVSARPSDSIALALRTGSPIYGTEDVFNSAGIEIPDQADDQVEAFREFLDQINPEDFLG